MVLTVFFVLSSVTGLFCHRRSRELLRLENLTPASGRQDHTTSPSATTSFVWRAANRSRVRLALRLPLRARHCRVHRIPYPTSVTIAIRPSTGTGWREENRWFGWSVKRRGNEYFSERAWTDLGQC